MEYLHTAYLYFPLGIELYEISHGDFINQLDMYAVIIFIKIHSKKKHPQVSCIKHTHAAIPYVLWCFPSMQLLYLLVARVSLPRYLCNL